METLLWGVLGYIIYPAWLVVGVLDLATHQQTHIAETSGPGESALHVAQLVQLGVPVLLVLFFQLNLLLLTVIGAFVLAHTITAYIDIAYTTYRRFISPLEQFAHAFLITVPIAAAAVLALILWLERHDPAVSSTMNANEWALQLRQAPWDPTIIIAVLGASFVFSFLPAAAEFVQTWRARGVATRRGE